MHQDKDSAVCEAPYTPWPWCLGNKFLSTLGLVVDFLIVCLFVFGLWGFFSPENCCSSSRVTPVIKNPDSKRNIHFRDILTCCHSHLRRTDGVLKAFLSCESVACFKLPSQNTSSHGCMHTDYICSF